MGLDSYAVLGNTLDEYENIETQEDLNIRSMHMYHQKRLLDIIDKKISKYELKYLFEELSRTAPEFWKLVLRYIIKVYSLNSIRPYLSDGYSNVDLVREVRKLLVFIKVVLINQDIKPDLTRQKVVDIFKKHDAPKLMNVALIYIDDISLENFLTTLHVEGKQEYYEE